MNAHELADFEPSTSHLHGCHAADAPASCRCIHHLYAAAQDAEAEFAARVAAARADAWDEGFDYARRNYYSGATPPNPYRAAVAVPEPENQP